MLYFQEVFLEEMYGSGGEKMENESKPKLRSEEHLQLRTAPILVPQYFSPDQKNTRTTRVNVSFPLPT